MAVENGKAVEGVKEKSEGHTNGHAIGHVVKPKRRGSPPRKGWKTWLLNNGARLSIWYMIVTILFQCPSDSRDLTEESPRICQPYFSTRSYLQPYVQPYYDTHAAPYVEKVKPYVNQANSYVVRPASKIAMNNYQKFAAPQVHKLQKYVKHEWDRMMLPQVLLAQERASDLYTSNLAPHIDKASAIASPYYEAAKDNAGYVHQQHILPALENSKPHLNKAYVATQKFTVNTALPLARQGWLRFVIFVDGTFWPFVKGVYSDNVRPQLVMISERIAAYQEGRKLRAIVDEADSSFTSSSLASVTTGMSTASATNIPGVAASMTSVMSSIAEEVSSSIMPKSTRETRVATEESIKDDLVKWQKKFALAADKGADDLRERIQEIARALVQSDLDDEGKKLATALEDSVKLNIQNVKDDIQMEVATDPANAEDKIADSVRKAGLEIRQRAVKLRDWVQKFQTQVSQRTELAADSTLQVLDSIRDLGLQEIGMRWAWSDGVTHKHWAKYHDLRHRFDDWRAEVREVAINHPAVNEAIESAQRILEEGMAITEDGAKELIRLKEVAKWKAAALDSSDNFESRAMPARVVSAASRLAAELQGAASSMTGSSQGTMESLVSQASESADSLSEAASSMVAENIHAAQPVVSGVWQDASSVASSASLAAFGSSTGSAESFFSDAAASASSMVVGTSTGPIEGAASSLSSAAGYAYGSVSSMVTEASSSVSSVVELPSASSAIEEAFESASGSAASIASSASSWGLPGAVAQEVKGQAPILDDVFDDDTKESFSDTVQSMVNEAGDRYTDITKVLSEALYGTTQNAGESLTSLASEQYQSALSAASSILYGTPTPAAEILASAAQSRYRQAVAAASSAIYSTKQTAFAESMLRDASAAYSAAISQAQGYSSAAVDVVSKQIAASSKPVHIQMLESISSAYDGSVAIASARLDEVLSAASKNYVSLTSAGSAAIPTQNGMESLSSLASSRLKEALTAASAQYQSVKVAVGAEPAPATLQAQQAYYAAIGYAYEQYANFMSAGSSAIHGTPTPMYQSLLAQASSQYSVLSAAASSSYDVYLSSLSSVASQATKTKSPAQSLLDEASSSYASVLSVASASLAVASSSASIAVFGTPTPVYKSALDAANSQYTAASAVAASNLNALLESASSAVGKSKKGPAQSVLDNISSQYDIAIAAASSSLSAASASASVAIYGTPPPAYQSALDVVNSQYAAATALAVSNMNDLLASASSAVGKKKKSPAQSILDSISSRYDDAVAVASSSLSAASVSASSAFYGPPEGSFESAASVASTNWDALVAAASSNIYGKPTPVWAAVTSQAGEYTAQATDVAAEKFLIISAYVSEIIIGQEPDFTESVMNRLSSVYYTGVIASASSLASEAYASGSSIASSVSSMASTYFTPPPEVNSILDNVNSQLNAAIEAASAQVYGSSKGPVERATSAVADAYTAASSAASEAVYGSSAGYGEAASSSIAYAAESASSALSIALFGTPTGSVESATLAAAETYSSISSVVSDSLSKAADQAVSAAGTVQARISEAVFGPEQNALESAQSKVLEAVESARSRLAELGISASVNVENAASVVSENVQSAASEVSKSVSSVTSRAKDEL